MAGPGYGGFFLKGLAGGLQTGINLGIQIQEMQWQKAQRKKLEEKEKKIEEGMATFGSLIRQYGEDNIYSDEEVMQLNTAFMASIAEVQAAYKDAMNNIQTINKRKLEEDFQLLDLVVSSIDDLSPGDAQGIFDTVKGWVQTDKAKNYFTAFEDIHRKRYEAKEPDISKELGISAKLPEEYRYPYLKGEGIVGEIIPTKEVPKEPGITDYKGAADYLSKFAKTASPETFEKIRAGLQKQFPNIDLSSITQESLREPEKPIPEGEITAGEKRTYDMASSIMFGSSDWVTGISKPGIISTMISNKLNMGQPLTDEEKTEVRNNYNLIKDTLPGEVIGMVESQLQRYGIPLVEPTPTITPTITPEPKPGIIQKGVEGVKKWLGMEGLPKTEEIPTPKVSPRAKEAMIPMMTKKELYDALLNTDRSDPLWDLLYKEAVKRGYITE